MFSIIAYVIGIPALIGLYLYENDIDKISKSKELINEPNDIERYYHKNKLLYTDHTKSLRYIVDLKTGEIIKKERF